MDRTKELGTEKQSYLQYYTVLFETIMKPSLFNTYIINKTYNVIISK